MTINAHCIQRLVLHAPSVTVHTEIMNDCLKISSVADSSFGILDDIDILLRADVYHHLLRPGLIRQDTFIIQFTALGWIFTGQMLNNNDRRIR